jgi:nitrous oxidase accessory protein
LIEGNHSEGSQRYGMHFMFSHNNVFINNIFQKNSTGVAIMYSKGILVKKNKFYKNWGVNSYGILVKDITLSKFIKNEFIENTIAIKADSASRNLFSENQFIKNGWAIQVFGNCDGNEFSFNNFISNIFDISTNSRQNENKFTENYWDNYDGYDLEYDKIGDKPYHPVKLFSFWVNNYPFLMVLFKSPVIEILEIAEKAFPVLTPSELVDQKPHISPLSL